MAEPSEDGWRVNAQIKEAILLYFALAEMRVMEVGPSEFFDKIPLQHPLEVFAPEDSVRLPAVGRVQQRRVSAGWRAARASSV